MDNIALRLKLLVADLEKIDFASFLITIEFDRYCIENGIEELWDYFYQKIVVVVVKSNFIFFTRKRHCYEALNLLLDHLFRLKPIKEFRLKPIKEFNDVIHILLEGFIQWNEKEINLDDIFKDLSLINFPEAALDNLKNLHQNKQEKIKTNQKNIIAHKEPDIVESPKNLVSQNQKENWINKIAEDDVETVIDELKKLIAHKSYQNKQNEIVNLTSRWHRLEKSRMNNTQSFDEINRESNQINEALLSFIKNLKNSI